MLTDKSVVICSQEKMWSAAHRQKCGHLLTDKIVIIYSQVKMWSSAHKQKCVHLLTEKLVATCHITKSLFCAWILVNRDLPDKSIRFGLGMPCMFMENRQQPEPNSTSLLSCVTMTSAYSCTCGKPALVVWSSVPGGLRFTAPLCHNQEISVIKAQPVEKTRHCQFLKSSHVKNV